MNAAEPSRSALHVALRRAAHQLHDAPPRIFDDPLAVRILGPGRTADLARTPSSVRRHSGALRAFIVARARLAEDAVAAAYGRGVRQYLILGAGLDTFAYRNPFSGLRVFEVDHPNTQAWKHELLTAAQIPIPRSVTHIPVDFEHWALGAQLRHSGFHFAAPAIVSWLGVVPYLTPEAFRSTLQLLGSCPPGSELLFDYSLPRELLPPDEQRMLDSQAARVQQAGERFRLFLTPEELQAELAAAGFRLVEDLDFQAINALFFAARSDGLKVLSLRSRICHAAIHAPRS